MVINKCLYYDYYEQDWNIYMYLSSFVLGSVRCSMTFQTNVLGRWISGNLGEEHKNTTNRRQQIKAKILVFADWQNRNLHLFQPIFLVNFPSYPSHTHRNNLACNEVVLCSFHSFVPSLCFSLCLSLYIYINICVYSCKHHPDHDAEHFHHQKKPSFPFPVDRPLPRVFQGCIYCPDFYHRRSLLSVLEPHINGIMAVCIFYCLASFTQHLSVRFIYALNVLLVIFYCCVVFHYWPILLLMDV